MIKRNDIMQRYFAKDIIDKILDSIFDEETIGEHGEKLTERELKFIRLLGRKGKILRNVYIPKDNGETTEIDIVYITQKGIFVIESKNYSGWIFGNEKDQQTLLGVYHRARLRNDCSACYGLHGQRGECRQFNCCGRKHNCSTVWDNRSTVWYNGYHGIWGWRTAKAYGRPGNSGFRLFHGKQPCWTQFTCKKILELWEDGRQYSDLLVYKQQS